MLTRTQFQNILAEKGSLILDGATGTNLQAMGMPRGCCSELWILEHPDALVSLQRRYAQAGSDIIYAPTFQCQPIALERVGLAHQTEALNAKLVALTRQAAPEALVAGNITTLTAFTDSWDSDQFDLLVENYRRQIRGLIDGGADLLAAETLLYPQESEAIFTAAELEGAQVVTYSYTMQPDGALFSGMDALPVLQSLADAGAAAVGFNCVALDEMVPGLVSKLRRNIRIPVLCKPNAGNPVIGADQLAHYPLGPQEFASIMKDCATMGARLLGGCCGTTPDHIQAVRQIL